MASAINKTSPCSDTISERMKAHHCINVFYMKTTRELLKELREDNDLTQRTVAQVLGVSQQQYSRYETGSAALPLRHFITLAYYYNISADYLIGRHANADKPSETIYLTKHCTFEQFSSDVFSLNARSRQAVLDFTKLQKRKDGKP